MEFSDLTIRLLFLFLPGIISVGLIHELTIVKYHNNIFYFVQAFVFGTLSYAILGLFNQVYFLECILDNTKQIVISEILWATLIGFILGIIATVLSTYEILHRFARKFKITRKFAESDVWGHLFNSPDIAESWVVIRDSDLDLIYEGWVEFFSNDVKENELFIRDVIVYCNATGDELYKLDGLYISRDKNSITLEFRELNNSNKQVMNKEEITNE
jgi:hypothetical protein